MSTADLAFITQEVYAITNRPDRAVETAMAIRSATLKAHQSDYYYKDIFEVGVSFDAASFVQNLDYRSLIPRWRAIKYLRKIDITVTPPLLGIELTLLLPDQIFDNYKIQKEDVYYVAGAFVQINSSTEDITFLLGCYLNPDITDTGYDSWVSKDHPYAIVFDAAATVFKAIGKDEEAAAYKKLVEEQIAMLKLSNVLAEGY